MKLLRLFFTLALALISMNLSSMVSFHHSKNGKGQQLLVIGAVHTMSENPNIPAAFTKVPLETLVQQLGDPSLCDVPLPLLVEGSSFKVSHAAARLSPVLTALKVLYKRLLSSEVNPLEIQLVDGRGLESDVVNQCIFLVTDLISRTTPQADIYRFYNITVQPAPNSALLESFTDLIRRTEINVQFPVSVEDYLTLLKKYRARMQQIATKHEADEKAFVLLTNELARYDSAVKKINALLQPMGNIPLWQAIYMLFFDGDTPRKRIEKLIEIEQLFLDDTDFLFQDFCMLDGLLEHLNKGCPAIALFMGNTHAKSFLRIANALDFATLSSRSMLTIDTSLATNYCLSTEFVTNLRCTVQSLIAYHKEQSKATVTARQGQCHQCFTFAKTLTCAGCKKAAYCGKACQKLAWSEHKSSCKASSGEKK